MKNKLKERGIRNLKKTNLLRKKVNVNAGAGLRVDLVHIQLEIRYQRGVNLRYYIDSWYCHKHNISSWNKIINYCASSENSKNHKFNTYLNKKTYNKYYTRDYAVPINILKTMLLGLGKKATLFEIDELLNQYVTFVRLTKEEKGILNDRKKGYYQRMPLDWDKNNIYARYDALGIVIIK